MLVLTLKENEAVYIDGERRVVVSVIKGDRVRLGFDFPQSVPVHREEVHRRIEAEAAQAAIDGHGLESSAGAGGAQ